MTSDPAEQRFLRELATAIGHDAVDERGTERSYFAEDALGRRGRLADATEPLAVVRPANAAAVATALALATRYEVPVVGYGAGTGLMGGARSLKRGIVLDTVRLKSIEVQAGDRLAWAGSGVVLQELDAALRPHGLRVGHDPWTFPVATVGGTLSTNSLGYQGGRYGGMGDQALALEVALANGTLIRTRALPRHSAGPRLDRLFIGAEGTLGIITAAAIRAFAIPERQELRCFYFDSFADGWHAIDAGAALGLRPILLDYGEEHTSPWPDIVEREEEAPVLYLGFEGFDAEVEASLACVESIVAAHGGRAGPHERVREFWDDRHVVAERFARNRERRERGNSWTDGAVARDFIHVSLPASQVLPFQQHAHAFTAQEGIGLLECGLWVAPELFSAVLALPQALGGADRLGGVVDALLRDVQDRGGSMEYVHGAGLRLAHLMAREHGVGLDVLRRLKRELDPAGILNPGKLGL